MNMPRSTSCLMLGLLLTTGAVHATEISVEVDGSGDYPTIGEALAASAAGDVVVLGEGTFAPSASGEIYPLDLVPGVTVRGAGVDLTVLDAEFGEGLLTVDWTEDEGGPVAVEDLTLTRGEAPNDGEADVLYMWQAQGRLERVALRDVGDPGLPYSPWNQDSWIDARSSALELIDVEVTDSHGSHAGLLCDSSEITLRRVRFDRDDVYYGVVDLGGTGCGGQLEDVRVLDSTGSNCSGAFVNAGAAPAVNLELAGNDVGPCPVFAGVELVHATVAGNLNHGGQPSVEVERLGHSIVAFNTGGVELVGEQPRAVSSCAHGNTDGDWLGDDPTGSDGNTSEAPGFASMTDDPATRDLRLADDSPLLDAGSGVGELTAAEDIEGTARPIDGDGDGEARPDPGAYEHPTFEPGDDDDSAGADDDDDGCACSTSPSTSPGGWLLAGLLGALAMRRRRG